MNLPWGEIFLILDRGFAPRVYLLIGGEDRLG
jgi:hypothetical protein